ncbi:MAG: hypothetical protein PHC64_04640 [Candidatus Gastranaerophilales bacterium]|nr:hypothetical protein [Candidatus Gastranaerophilales bacterium]
MAYTEHKLFKTPYDEIVIWRYIDLPAFIYLLQEKKLFFRRIDKFDDPFEAACPKPIRKIYEQHARTLSESIQNLNKESLDESYKNEREKYREFFYVSAWHINDFESSAMWKIYSCLTKGIAIKSTVGRLKESFKNSQQEVNIGKINYLKNYEDDNIPGLNIDSVTASLEDVNVLAVTLIKRKSFEFENELRAVIFNPPKSEIMNLNIKNLDDIKKIQEESKEGALLKKETPESLSVPVDLNVLIDSIYVSPTGERWIFNIIENLVKDYNLDKKVYFSKLGENPIY